MRLELSHLRTFSISASQHVATFPMFSPEAYNVFSSAKLHIYDFSMQNTRLKSSDPVMESCGTPDDTRSQSLKVVLIFTRGFMFDR